MYKKMLFFIICALMTLSSFTYATSQDVNLSVYLGDTINLKTYLQDHNYDLVMDEHTSLRNANSHVISIDDDFNITTIAVGQSVIVVNNNNILTPINITVKSTIKEIVTPKEKLVLLLGEIYPLEYTIIYEDGYTGPIHEGLKWTADPVNVAGIKDINKIYSHHIGQTKLTGTSPDGSTSITLDVQVINNPDYLAIIPSVLDNNIKVGEQRQLKAYFGDKDVTHLIEWESEYPEFIEVDQNGLITPLRAGSSRIIAKPSIKSREKSYAFNVTSMIDGITVDQKSIKFDAIGDRAQLNATLIYKKPDEKALLDGYYFESVNPSVASVTPDGLITAKGPGITLIKAIANDSGKWAACTVEVPEGEVPTSIDYTLVREVELTPYNQNFIIGDKIPINYTITPEDATDQSVRFNLVGEDNSQVHLIDGQYYLVPEKRGVYHLEIHADNDEEDMIEVIVHSPLVSMELDLSINNDERSKNKLYIGEKTEVLTDFDTQGHYTDFDIYPSTLEYDVDDPEILKLESINGRHYVTALKAGETHIRVENIEGRYDEMLKVRVVNPAKKLYTHSTVKMPMDMAYTPQVTYEATSASESFGPFNVAESIQYKVEAFYFEESYIESEIAYERDIISILKKSATDPSIASTITKHEKRLNQLFNVRRNASQGYCLLKNNYTLDRDFEPYRPVTIDGNKIIGHYPSKATLSISLDGSATSVTSDFYWHEDTENFSVTENRKTLTYKDLLKNYNLEGILADLAEEEQVAYCAYYLAHKADFQVKPSLELLAAFMNIEDNALPASIKSNLAAITSKEELAYVAMYLEERYTQRLPLDTSATIYFDVANEAVRQAITKGYVQPISDNYLGLTTAISYSEFKALVDLILPTNTLSDTFEGEFNHHNLLLLLNQLN